MSFIKKRLSTQHDRLTRVISLEGNETDGLTRREKEIVYYVKVQNPDELFKSFTKEEQEQWEIKVPRTVDNAAGGRIRVRKAKIGNELKYILTSKTFIDKNDHDETELLTTESMFNQFRQMSESGMIKHRCELKIEGDGLNNIIDVDLFLTPEGHYNQWIKVDVEIQDLNSPLPKLPFDYLEILEDGIEANEKRISRLYTDVFLTKNPLILPTKNDKTTEQPKTS
jgi:hypothetical protein